MRSTPFRSCLVAKPGRGGALRGVNMARERVEVGDTRFRFFWWALPEPTMQTWRCTRATGHGGWSHWEQVGNVGATQKVNNLCKVGLARTRHGAWVSAIENAVREESYRKAWWRTAIDNRSQQKAETVAEAQLARTKLVQAKGDRVCVVHAALAMAEKRSPFDKD